MRVQCRLRYVCLPVLICTALVRIMLASPSSAPLRASPAPPGLPKLCGAAAARGSANCAAMGGVRGRVCPSFLILGERKCGTSALVQYALDHPHVLPPRQKECGFFSKPDRCSSAGFFDAAPARDRNVYAANFPEAGRGIGGGPADLEEGLRRV